MTSSLRRDVRQAIEVDGFRLKSQPPKVDGESGVFFRRAKATHETRLWPKASSRGGSAFYCGVFAGKIAEMTLCV